MGATSLRVSQRDILAAQPQLKLRTTPAGKKKSTNCEEKKKPVGRRRTSVKITMRAISSIETANNIIRPMVITYDGFCELSTSDSSIKQQFSAKHHTTVLDQWIKLEL